MTADKFQEQIEDTTNRLGVIGVCCFLPFTFVWGLFGLTLLIASVVFGTQGLVVGSAFLASHNMTLPTYACDNTINIWMIVGGATSWYSIFMFCCCKCCQHSTGDEMEKKFCQGINELVGCIMFLFSVGWLAYGMSLLGSLDRTLCTHSTFAVFEMYVLFLFWGHVAFWGSLLLIFWTICAAACGSAN